MNKNITCCILAKNEEKNIEKCIESAKILTDDIVIIDNNSTDKTFDISKKYVSRVYRHGETKEPKLRNYFFEYSDRDWIFSLDADERIDSRLANEIDVKVLNKDLDGFRLPLFNYFGGVRWSSNLTCKLYRNNKKYRYDNYDIHTSIGGSIINNSKNIGVISSPLHHLDALQDKRNQKKRGHYTDNLSKYSLCRDNTRILNYLAVEYITNRDFRKAEEILKFVIGCSNKDSFLAMLFLGELYLQEGLSEVATEVFLNLISFNVEKECSRISLAEVNKYDAVIIANDLKQRAYGHLAEIKYLNGEFEEAIFYIDNALKLCPKGSQFYLSKASLLYFVQSNKNDIYYNLMQACKYNSFLFKLLSMDIPESKNNQYYFQSTVLS